MTERWRPAGAEGWLRLPVVSGCSSVVPTGSAGWLAGWAEPGGPLSGVLCPVCFSYLLELSFSSLKGGVVTTSHVDAV